ncbi:MAG TPA: TlpA disulfide reductase family protein [Phycisphaerae bacterium]|nr:TlpA disulfide reductase family protein [Phycisphaerae bacterium]
MRAKYWLLIVVAATALGPVLRGADAPDATKMEQWEREMDARRAALVGKPLVIEGRTSTGGEFSSSAYKGKVILVDFWATWCPPCQITLPEVQKAYAKYHDRGLEVIGVSCDPDEAKLNSFIKDHEMPWPQLREESQKDEKTRWNPVATKLGVWTIPTFFLIDRNGIVSSSDLGGQFEKKVEALLAEKPAAATQR